MAFEINSSLVQEWKFCFAHLIEKFHPLTFHGNSKDCWAENFRPSLVQRKKSYSWTPEILIVYKKLIYPSTYIWEFTRHPTTAFQKVPSLVQGKISNGWVEKYLALYLYKGKIGHLYAQTKQKRPTHPRTTKRGVQSASRSVRIVHVRISLWIGPFVFQFLSHGLVGALS